MFAQWSWGQDARGATEGLKKSYMEKREGFEQETRKAMKDKDQKQLNRILGILEQNSPNSFDYHLVKYINGNYDFSEEEHLLKAFEMRPTDPIVNREMFAYYHLKNDHAKTNAFAPAILRQHPLLTKHYFKQLSKSHKGGYLLCSGEGDAFPFMALQDKGDVSVDIEVIALDFLQNETYEKKIQKQFGITESFTGNEKAFVSALVKKAGKQMKVSTTVSQS